MSSMQNVPDISDYILKYLEEQQQLQPGGEDDYDYLLAGPPSTLLYSRDILDKICLGVANRAHLIEAYEAAAKKHHQYPLVNLTKVLPQLKIDDETFERINFRETLVISLYDGQEPDAPRGVGGLCLNIQKASGFHTCLAQPPTPGNASRMGPDTEDISSELDFVEPKCKYLVHVFSQFDVEGNSGGSRIIAWVDRNLHTLEEKRIEFLEADESLEQTLYCAMQQGRYYVRHTDKQRHLNEQLPLDFDAAKLLVLEGANFVLMRFLALQRFIGEFQLETLYIEGALCTNYYKCTGPESQTINGQKMDVCKIYRKIEEECGITHESITVLSLTGQIMKQEWRGCDYVMHLNPMAEVSNAHPPTTDHLLLKEVWRDDLQMFSNYLDKQTNVEMEMKSYLNEHSEIHNVLADFIQRIMLMKPENAIDFTMEHFTGRKGDDDSLF